MSSLLEIPEEILLKILSSLYPEDVYAIRQCNTYIKSATQFMLLHKVVFDWGVATSDSLEDLADAWDNAIIHSSEDYKFIKNKEKMRRISLRYEHLSGLFDYL